ncbi:MAG: LysM peptidoglycan-binding domain-containing protein [Anaerolineales bacterium]|nr:LysM peptidoglycan-binding domain-containing protein [Anaerolineales bacterium]
MSKRVAFGICLTALAITLLVAACQEMQVITPEPGSEGTPARGTSAPTATSMPGMTSTPPPLPPADTATPTVTPTPVIYIVQKDDSLYSIAFEYGISPDLLQSANNIEDPRFLSIGQELVIPAEQETADTTSDLLLPTPTPLPLEVRGVAFYETPVGSLWCLGEIVNTSAITLTNVQLLVTLYDNEGQPAASADAFAAADLVPPGSRSPFGVLFTAPPQTWANPQVSIIRGEMAGGLEAAYVPITVATVTGQPTESQLQVNGTVQNTSATQAAGYVYVIATAYNADGLVTGFRQEKVAVEGALAPGATAPFSMLFSFHGEAPANFEVVALGRVSAE